MDGIFLATAWYIPLIIKFLFGNILTPAFSMQLSRGTYLPQKLAIQFFFCSVFAGAITLYLGGTRIDTTIIAISVVGVANAWAAYASWRAMAINLSKMSLFVLINPGLSMVLSVVFLGESQHLGTMLLIGMTLNLGAMFFMGYADFRKRESAGQRQTAEVRQESKKFYLAVITYSFIWGISNFLVKYWSLNNVPLGAYISGWYIGSFVGALSIVVVLSRNSYKKELFGRNQLTRTDMLRLILVSLTILVSLGAVYWAHFLAPQLVVFPLLILGDKIGPVIVGFLFFKERDKFNKGELVYLVMGVFGGGLIALSFL